MSWQVSVWATCVLVAVVPAYLLGRYAWLFWSCSFRNLKGPPRAHWLHGNTQELTRAPNGSLQKKWFGEYGQTLRYPTANGSYTLLTMDPLAVGYIHKHSEIFLQPAATRQFSLRTMGPSLTAAEGPDHKRQRKAIAPSFSAAQIKIMTPTLFEKAYEMIDTLPKGAEEVDLSAYIHRLTVDVIGATAFDTEIGALRGEASELITAWRSMLVTNTASGFWTMLQKAGWPFDRLIKTERSANIDSASSLMHKVGGAILKRQRDAITKGFGEDKPDRSDFSGHDLITNLMRLSMSGDVPEDQRMSDEEVVAQMPLFLFAGNTTVAVTLTWAVGLLAKNPEMQSRLREEVLAVQDPSPDWATLHALPYLEAFTHELLRLYPAAPTLFRVAQRDVILPLASPVVDRSGHSANTVAVKKGSTVHIAYGQMNTSEEVFGPTAEEFRPERFLSEGSTWDTTYTFGGGSRNCIGSRLAVAEIKATLFAVVRSLELTETPSKPEFTRFGGLGLARPKVGGKLTMPLVVRSL